MARCVVSKGPDGQLVGWGEKGGRAWGKFRAMLSRLEIGNTLEFSWHEPRAPSHHRNFFRFIGALFKQQEQFDDEDRLRAWLTVGAGECDLFPGPHGRAVAIAKSIAWDKLDEVEFSELDRRVIDFLWTPHARGFLWGHLTDQQSYDLVEQLRLELSR